MHELHLIKMVRALAGAGLLAAALAGCGTKSSPPGGISTTTSGGGTNAGGGSSSTSGSGASSGSTTSSGGTASGGATSSSGSTGSSGGSTSGGGSSGASSSSGGTTGVVSDPFGVAPAAAATVAASPQSPPDDTGAALSWPSAPLMQGVTVAPDRDSAIIGVPAVSGAVDYRVMVVPAGVQVSADGTGAESVTGSTIWCAGYRQHNAPAGPLELLQQIEVTGLTGPTRLVVEAVDQACPFTGLLGRTHQDVNVTFSEVEPAAQGVFSIFTEPEIRAAYGNLIFNGHAPAAHPGSPAPNVAPHVLARTTVEVTPVGLSATGMTFFDDFSDPTDQPQFVSAMNGESRAQNGLLYQNSKWSFLSYGSEKTQFFIDRGQLHSVLADWSQDVFGSNIAYPRRVAQLGTSDYLHVTYDVASDATSRRYWWTFLCGADTPGATIDASGNLLGNIVQTPFFMDADGLNPSVEGWNCLQIFPRQGWPFGLPPDNSNPQSEVRVMTNMPGNLGRTSVVNESPMMYSSTSIGPPSWFRQLDASGNPVAPILDDQQLIAPRTHFDLYVSRSRVVLYVNGQQRICNDLGSHPLTMAEAAVGFGQVLYHSAAERLEFAASYWDRRGQRYYLQNTPFVDGRTWDDLGYQEHVGLPSGFDPSVCYGAP